MNILKGKSNGLNKDNINILERIKMLLKHVKNNKKRHNWKLYLYLNGQCVKKMKIDEDFAPMNKFYVVKVKGMKHLLGTNKKVQMVVRSYKYKMTDESKKESHIEVVIYEGVEVNE